MIIRPYGSEKFDKPGFEAFYGAIKIIYAPKQASQGGKGIGYPASGVRARVLQAA